MDAATLNSLRLLARQLQADDQAGQLDSIERIGINELFELKTIVWALCVGGIELVNFIAALATEYAAEPARYETILTACRLAQEAGADDASVKTSLIFEILKSFGHEDTAESFLLTIQNELAIASGSPTEIHTASVAEMKRGHWAAAAQGFLRLHAQMKAQTPTSIYARAAECLHRLGRFAEAERLSMEGLGPQRDLISLRNVPPPEAIILSRWKNHAAPVVSIVCMTYNQERYIENTIRGFLTQETEFPFEILIHDDASKDGAPALIRGWQEKYPHIIRSVLQTENQTLKGVRPFELLLKQTRGRYVATCEGDDYWIAPNKLQKQVKFLEENPDYSCSGHSYFLYNESRLSVQLWDHSKVDRIISERQLMNVSRLLWLPTLVFRKTFSVMPAERDFAPIGDQFLTSYLGTFGKGMYFESFLGAVRRENQFSAWTPLAAQKKEHIRVKTWLSLARLHENLGNELAAADLQRRIDGSSLDAEQKAALTRQSMTLQTLQPLQAIS